jgi:hypothetical protein
MKHLLYPYELSTVYMCNTLCVYWLWTCGG